MTTLALMQSVGSIGAFSNRAFIPAFLTAAFLRYGPEVGFLSNSPLLQQVKDTPTWFTHDITLAILAALSLVEILFDKSPNWRELVRQYQPWAQTVLALATTFGVLSTQDEEFIRQAIPPIVTAGLGDFGLPALVALGTLTLSGLMWQLERVVGSIDPDDAFNFGRFFSFWRDISAVGLILIAIFIPVLAIILVGLSLLVLSGFYGMSKRAEARSKVTCSSCNKLMFASASHCPHCNSAQREADIRGLNWLGFTSSQPAGPHHEFDLLAAHRCPRCAEPLQKASLPACCKPCGREYLNTHEAREAYVAQVRNRLPWTMGVAFLCSFLPALGFAISYLTNRFALMRPLRAHTPTGRRILARMSLRLCTALALLLHYVPFIGQLILPFVSWLSYRVFAQAFPTKAPEFHELEQNEALAVKGTGS